MKNRKMFALLGIGLAFGVVGGTATMMMKPATNQVSAANSATAAVALTGSFTGWGDIASGKAIAFTQEKADADWTLTHEFKAGDTFKILVQSASDSKVHWVGYGKGQSITPAGSIVEAATDSNFQVDIPGSYTITAKATIGTYGDMTYGLTFTAAETATFYTATFDLGYKVAGGEGNYLTSAKVKEGEKPVAPNAMMYGKKAVWTPSLDTPVTKDTTYTATWVDTSETRDEIYYVLDGDDGMPTHFYGWDDDGGSPFGAWPGTPIPVDDISTVLHVNVGEEFTPNEGKVVRIQVPTDTAITNFILNGDKEWKTGNVVYTAGAAYFGSEVLKGSVANGAFVDLMLDTEDARNAVKASGDIKAYSICGIDQAIARRLYERYLECSKTGDASILSRSVTYTYVDGDNEGNVNYADIMEQVGLIGGISNNALHYAMNNGTNNSATYLVMGLVLLTAIAVSAFAIVRKKKTR